MIEPSAFLGKNMRFHKSESAFFVFIALVLAACLALLYAHDVLRTGREIADAAERAAAAAHLSSILFGTAMLLASTVVFGAFFIYPLIRTQVREEGKLRAMTASLSARSQKLEHEALTDALTGMQNRRYFDDALREYLEEFRRIDKPIGLMILDLDHFKHVNDTHGHDVGDEVLRSVANCLKDFTRFHDVVARLGGEEFAVVAPNMDEDLLMKLAERIRSAISALPIVTGNIRIKVTTSVGLAVWNRRETAGDFYRRADRMLYEAKRTGRNRVCA